MAKADSRTAARDTVRDVGREDARAAVGPRGRAAVRMADQAAALGLRISKSEVSRIAGCDEQVQAFRERPLEGRCPYLFVDAKIEKIRDGGRVQRKCVEVAHAVRETGAARSSGWTSAKRRPRRSGREFLRNLDARGLVGVQLASSDAHPGMKRRWRTVLGAPWQPARALLRDGRGEPQGPTRRAGRVMGRSSPPGGDEPAGDGTDGQSGTSRRASVTCSTWSATPRRCWSRGSGGTATGGRGPPVSMARPARGSSRWRARCPRRAPSRAQGRHLPSAADARAADPQALGKEAQKPGHLARARQDRADGGQARARADLRGGLLPDLVWIQAQATNAGRHAAEALAQIGEAVAYIGGGPNRPVSRRLICLGTLPEVLRTAQLTAPLRAR